MESIGETVDRMDVQRAPTIDLIEHRKGRDLARSRRERRQGLIVAFQGDPGLRSRADRGVRRGGGVLALLGRNF